MYVKVNDRCGKEKYCFRPQLPYIINCYSASESLSEEEMKTLDTIINEMETQKKCFDLKQDFDQIRADIAGALKACMDDTAIDTVAKEQEEMIVIQKSEATPIVDLKEYRRKKARRFGAVALAVTAALSIGAVFALKDRK